MKNLTFTAPENEVFIGRICEATYRDSYIYIEFDDCFFKGKELEGKTFALIFPFDTIDKIDIGSILKCNATLVNRYYSGEIESDIFGGLYYEITEIDNMQIVGAKVNFYEIAFLKVRAFLRKNLSKEGYAMAIALTLGNTSYLPVETLQTYRFAGIAHVFAVSGLHVGVFVSIFTFISSRLKIKRKLKPFIILIPTFIYCGICGFRPSSVRAFIMATVTIVSNYTGFKKDNLSSSSLAGLILLVANPMNLFDAGFKLSFLAVSSIFLLNPLFERGSNVCSPIGSGLSVSLSAQLATLPVLTDMSGYISIISVFANLIFVPVVVILYVVTLSFVICSLIIGIIAPAVSSIILSAPDYLLNACNFLISK
ncbi:MAG: ComEC/Rec2 family competence protein, partial [Clostridia bacterium]|nr:ComEC/Rec2 family competence protein [Clostridia bacterium]